MRMYRFYAFVLIYVRKRIKESCSTHITGKWAALVFALHLFDEALMFAGARHFSLKSVCYLLHEHDIGMDLIDSGLLTI